mmetsp:Transcript_22475/g.36762  ORF Transcript_22475/g.36762 Transcript_22475/m.36762 type:complete len:201 (+) Transcript_22475:134-736(+)
MKRRRRLLRRVLPTLIITTMALSKIITTKATVMSPKIQSYRQSKMMKSATSKKICTLYCPPVISMTMTTTTPCTMMRASLPPLRSLRLELPPLIRSIAAKRRRSWGNFNGGHRACQSVVDIRSPQRRRYQQHPAAETATATVRITPVAMIVSMVNNPSSHSKVHIRHLAATLKRQAIGRQVKIAPIRMMKRSIHVRVFFG